MQLNLSRYRKQFMSLLLCCLVLNGTCFADAELISLFPIEHYAQDPTAWITSQSTELDKPVLNLNMQTYHFNEFMQHAYGVKSPWDALYVLTLLKQSTPNDIYSVENSILTFFNNEDKNENQIHYGANFRPHSTKEFNALKNNVAAEQFKNLIYQAKNRGITIANLAARALPTNDPYFYNYKLPGQGYPFDNLQMSAIAIGTPIYVLGTSLDQAWSLVITPSFIAWIKSTGFAYTDERFIAQWRTTANDKLVALTSNKVSAISHDSVLGELNIGDFFPAKEATHTWQLLFPIKDAKHMAVIEYAEIAKDKANSMPFLTTPRHFLYLLTQTLGNPYGWGGYNGYNDCSQELKNLFTPFAIWLARHSSDQMQAGKMVDISALNSAERLAYLQNSAKPFTTIVYIGGHVFLYLGNYISPDSKTIVALSYQNIWGLAPTPAIRRAVIGQAVLLPILLQYPEDTTLIPLTSKKFFQLSDVSAIPELRLQRTDNNLLHLMAPSRMLNND